MAEKHIDLADRIKRGHGDDEVREGIDYALKWLDDHPDQVPGRAITASEFDEAVESCITEDATVPPHTFAARLGVVCVPDPEPTNAEKLEQLYSNWSQSTLNPPFGEWADSAGVKAPEEWESND